MLRPAASTMSIETATTSPKKTGRRSAPRSRATRKPCAYMTGRRCALADGQPGSGRRLHAAQQDLGQCRSVGSGAAAEPGTRHKPAASRGRLQDLAPVGCGRAYDATGLGRADPKRHHHARLSRFLRYQEGRPPGADEGGPGHHRWRHVPLSRESQLPVLRAGARRPRSHRRRDQTHGDRGRQGGGRRRFASMSPRSSTAKED
jgi:hypothetical protein